MKKKKRYPGNIWPAKVKIINTPEDTDLSAYRAIYGIKKKLEDTELLEGFPIDATIDMSGADPLILVEVPGTITAMLSKGNYYEAWSLIMISNGKETTIAERMIKVEDRFFPKQ